ITPLRIEYCEDIVLDIEVGTSASKPTPIPPPQPAPTTPSSSFTSSVAPLSPVSPAPPSTSTTLAPEEDRAFERYQSLHTKLKQASTLPQDDTGGGELRNEPRDDFIPVSHYRTTQTVHTTPSLLPAELPMDNGVLPREQHNHDVASPRQITTPQIDGNFDSQIM
ncbi:hypothetical protein BGZ76_008122, partial [Entomortierella beljakovae]